MKSRLIDENASAAEYAGGYGEWMSFGGGAGDSDCNGIFYP